ncbi:Ni/Fe hydrogenase subunit alpha [Geobacter sp. DSM 9736]|uniref:Ni/Fe hydrogenase subunit alpha n=1 Tax=Geobacter sp. DSM 9736 TaxID=1277350 RepID=UPI000B50F723|nr:Ni/Fe hydrogenase subunit alpha [Geobacter sp. DSM 9736]SNB44949.1 F420-non-reducing hydrogenase large subunit [Geobacter sp. DSM 9736]
MQRITIDPITRLEGHGKIEIFLNDQGNVENVYFQVPELRGFEQFCVGRLPEEMPLITSRICGVCPEAHHLASAKALDDLFGVDPPPAAKKIRELFYMTFYVTDHTTHFYALGGPDFIVGPDAPPSERNILGVVRKVGLDVAKEVIDCRARNHAIIRKIGGRGVHPTAGVPGGWSKPLTEEERGEIEAAARKNIDFALFSLKAFDDIVLKNPAFLDLVTSDIYLHRTYSMGTVDPNRKVNFYDGMIRVVDPEGSELVTYPASDYMNQIAERVEPWSYLKFPYLKKIGWKGFVDGKESGIYCATPLSRLNVSDGMATPRAQEEYERLYETFGCKKIEGRYQPIHHRLATHWARLIELLYAAEHMLELARDPEILSPEVRAIPQDGCANRSGIGSVEAPRGTLTHHYTTDEKGVLKKVNLLVGTTNNHAPIAMSIKRVAEKLITCGKVVEEGILNRVEMAFRLYDPCFSCATHTLPGKMPLTLNIRDSRGKTLRVIRREF